MVTKKTGYGSLFITDSIVNGGTGGGNVCVEIKKALEESVDIVKVVDRKVLDGVGDTRNPFMIDYFAEAMLEVKDEEGRLDTLVTYGAPFSRTVEKAIDRGMFVICDVAPHNVEESRSEHLKYGAGWNAPHLDNKFLWGLYTSHFNLADIVVTHSKKSGEYLKSKCAFDEFKVIPHGCYLPDKVVEPSGEFSVLHVGVNGFDKGQIYLVQALAVNLGGSVKSMFVGRGTRIWQNGIKAVDSDFGTKVSDEDLSEYYDGCSVYVQPTVTEGFGMPVFEAMAHARPVIVTEGAGSSEWVRDGTDGFVIPIRDSKAIADKIRYFKDNPSEVKRMGKNARRQVTQFTWDKVRGMYRELWE